MSDLVVVSLEPWDEIWRRNQHLVAGLLRTDPDLRVLFVEPAVDTTHGLRRSGRLARGLGLRPGELAAVAPGRLLLLQPTKLLPRRLDPAYERRWTATVLKAARALGMDHPVLWVNDTMGVELLRAAGWPTLYDITDDWLAARRPAAEHARLVRQEGELLRTATTVVACSPALVATKGRDRVVELVPNGVDTAAYAAPGPRPPDLPKGRVATYVGTVHTDRMDLDLCVRTAEALTGVGRLVLVGPTPLSGPDRLRLETSGVVLLGPRPTESVPGYLVHSDVLVVPHLVDEFTASLDPIKRYEYAAAGRPVVSTPVPGFTDGDAEVTEPGEFPAAVRSALLAAPVSSQRVDHPPSAVDWSERVGTMASLVAAARRPGGPVREREVPG